MNNKILLILFLISLSVLCSCKMTSVMEEQKEETMTPFSDPIISSNTPVMQKSDEPPQPKKTPYYSTPTLSDSISLDLVKIKLYELTNLPCDLPCIWGIVPGQSSFLEFEESYLPLGTYEFVSTPKGGIFYLQVPFSSEGNRIEYVISTDFDTVTEMLILLKDYKIGNSSNWWEVVAPLGQPDAIYLDQSLTQDQNYHRYSLLLSYKSKGVYLLLDGESFAVDANSSKFCPLSQEFLDRALIVIVSFPPDSRLEYSQLETINFNDWANFLAFDSFSSSMTRELFYQNYIENGFDSCFEMDLYLEDSSK